MLQGKADVVLLTFNSVNPVLRECLESLRREVRVDRLIVVDGGSTDPTLEICRQYFPECVVIDDEGGSRATARQKGIEAVQTEIFMFIDSDVILHPGWFREALKFFIAKVGAVQGSTLQHIEATIEDFDYAMRRLRKKLGGLTFKPFLEPVHRGFTGDILIKTELVKDIEIPRFLHDYEDHYIKRWIETKDFLWVRSSTATCSHHMVNRSSKAAYRSSYVGSMIGYVGVKRSLMALATIFPKILFALCLRPNLEMAPWQLRYQFWSTIGVLKSRFTARSRRDLQKIFQFEFGARKEPIETKPDYIKVI